eukprot:TRINITY_DN1394_c0_g1_i4.p1 TRINITY_DN1394_c0_g1~~TRINITY_DN1394_c0_g1_i4.p1  ORF type:complete len:561 (-),score=31.41 TRINITY_DN1394_c0_g1_i4:50-1732(-)
MHHSCVFLLLFFTAFWYSARSDLCTKCYASDTEGTWIFYVSKHTYSPNLFNPQVHCGHTQPNSPSLPKKTPLKDTIELQVTFESPNRFYLFNEPGKGWWTMVYNVGFWARTPQHEFFGLFLFSNKPNKTNRYDCKSICDKTMTSWYKDRETGKVGCFYGEKVRVFDAEEEPKIFANPRKRRIDRQLQEIKYEDLEFLVEKVNSQTDRSWNAEINEEYVGKSLEDLWKLMSKKNSHEKSAVSLQNVIDFLKIPGPDSSKRSAYFLQDFRESLRKSGFVVDTTDHVLKYWYMHVDDIPDSALPKNWDWRDVNGVSYMTPVKTQGACGSCYILGSLSVIESRTRIATKNWIKPELSAQQILSCSSYSEGCKGGEAITVGKFGIDFGYIQNQCFPYSYKEQKCEYKCQGYPGVKVGAAFASYVGDYHGSPGMNEKTIMKEIRARGPVTAGIISPLALPYYKSGIIACNGVLMPRENLSETEAEMLRRIKEGFRPVEHLVVIAGWGENEKGEKYWIIQNTWGEIHGDKGYFLLKRGGNECAIETDVVALYPKINNQLLTYQYYKD